LHSANTKNNTLTISLFLVFGDNKVKARKNNMGGATNELPHTLSMVASKRWIYNKENGANNIHKKQNKTGE
jgi:hypothetical protein